jgi:hypothetical protein
MLRFLDDFFVENCTVADISATKILSLPLFYKPSECSLPVGAMSKGHDGANVGFFLTQRRCYSELRTIPQQPYSFVVHLRVQSQITVVTCKRRHIDKHTL